MSANSRWAVYDVLEAHAELTMIVTVEVEKREVSLVEVQVFQRLISGGLLHSVLVERNVYLFPRFYVLQTISIPEGAKWFTSFACRVTKSRG